MGEFDVTPPAAGTTHGPRHYYEIRDPSGKRLGYGLISEKILWAGSHIPALLSRFPAGTTFRSEAISPDEIRTLLPEMVGGDWEDARG